MMSDERLMVLLEAIRQLRSAVTDLETGIRMASEQQEMTNEHYIDPKETRIYISDYTKEFIPMARKMVTKISLARQEYAKRRRVAK